MKDYMEIRNDFQPATLLLNRLVEYSKAFHRFNLNDWPHLKNKEDFQRVYSLKWDIRDPLEQIYRDGRDLAVFMSSGLVAFNYSDLFPTLKSFLDSFTGGWIYQIDILRNTSQNAKDKASELENCPWAVKEMISLFDHQIELLVSVRQTIEGLKETDIYKWESGKSQLTFPVPEYERILECIHSIGKMFERLPSTYSNKDEESLRDHILVSLEAVVLGSATGETFNKRGKTDILVRGASSNEFVGECKFWHGKEVFLETISQLLNYLSWRDTKAAVILFVPNADFTSVIGKMQSYAPEHPNYLRLASNKDETWYNYEFRMNDDPHRIVNVAIMLYHTP